MLRFVSPAALLLFAGCGSGDWGDPERNARMLVSVRANGTDRMDSPVSITGEFGEPVRIVEINEDLQVIDDTVLSQIDYQRDLTFVMEGETAADQVRLYYLYFGEGSQPEVKSVVTVSDRVMHQGQESVLVTTPTVSYYFHKKGAGFASLIDRDNKDWISYRPEEGSAGSFRGIPNVIHPEGGLHPGAETCRSDLLSDGPVAVRIHSSCHGGEWEAEWEIFPRHARLTIEKAPRPYWVLYEGTPGGNLDVDTDYWVTADGTRRGVSEEWGGRLQMPRWVYFGDPAVSRVLYMSHSEDDGKYDQLHQMDGQMAVFGFGRELPCCEKSLTRVPATFTIGLVESTDHETISKSVNGATTDLIITKGRVERRGGN